MWAPVFPSKSGYIDRKKLLVILDNGILNDPECPLHIAATVNQEIAFAPAADVEPVIHARWKKYRDTIKCSFCGFTMFPLDAYRKGGWANMRVVSSDEMLYIPRFCPDCGAKMDGEPTRTRPGR